MLMLHHQRGYIEQKAAEYVNKIVIKLIIHLPNKHLCGYHLIKRPTGHEAPDAYLRIKQINS